MSRIVKTKDNKYFAAISSYRKSKLFEIEKNTFDNYNKEYVDKLNKITEKKYWITNNEFKKNHPTLKLNGSPNAIFLIENDLEITKEQFFNILYRKLFDTNSWLWNENLTNDKKNFIRGFFELRGSIDPKPKWISIDYYYDNSFELSKAIIFDRYLNIPYYIINFNFRELQNQYINGVKRNTQLRLNLNWYLENIGLINDYKKGIVKNSFNNVLTPEKIIKKDEITYLDIGTKTHQKTHQFSSRLEYYSTNIFGKKLSNEEINELRLELGFDESSNTYNRNKELSELVRLHTPNVCSGCMDKYNIKDRTFIHKKTKKPYFEIHHNISLNNQKDLDHIDNLVKLCPVCHSNLKKGVGMENDQKNIIEKIITINPNLFDFASHFFNTNIKNELVEEIYKNLK